MINLSYTAMNINLINEVSSAFGRGTTVLPKIQLNNFVACWNCLK